MVRSETARFLAACASVKVRLRNRLRPTSPEAFEWYERKSLTLAIALSLASVRLSSNL